MTLEPCAPHVGAQARAGDALAAAQAAGQRAEAAERRAASAERAGRAGGRDSEALREELREAQEAAAEALAEAEEQVEARNKVCRLVAAVQLLSRSQLRWSTVHVRGRLAWDEAKSQSGSQGGAQRMMISECRPDDAASGPLACA